jgi:hypothetical protein
MTMGTAILLGSLHGIRGLAVDVEVTSPVPTAKTPGSTRLEYSDEVEVLITIGRVRIEAALTAGEYKQLLESKLEQEPRRGHRQEEELVRLAREADSGEHDDG